MASDWRYIENDKEKYAAYQASREWAEKREAVRERCGNTCERCGVLPMYACHHKTYLRKYDEPLEDLEGLCNPCHEYNHSKSGFNPAEWTEWLQYLAHCKSVGAKALPVCFDVSNRFSRPAAGYFEAIALLIEASKNYCTMANGLPNCASQLNNIARQLYRSAESVSKAAGLPGEYHVWQDLRKPMPPLQIFMFTLELFGLDFLDDKDLDGTYETENYRTAEV